MSLERVDHRSPTLNIAATYLGDDVQLAVSAQ
jgi:hypothetical protein